MGNLQKANLGTVPTGAGGDDQRTANTKFNSNVDVLNAQAALSSAPMTTKSQTLTADHIGKRISVSFATAGGVIKMKRASTCGPDSIVWLVNGGAKRVLLAPDDGSGDVVALSGLNPGEAAILDTDGVNTWRILMRGRSSADNEAVVGDLAVGGALSAAGKASLAATDVTGALSVTGKATLSATDVTGALAAKAGASIAGDLSVTGAVSSGRLRVNSANSVTAAVYSDAPFEMVIEALDYSDGNKKYNINLCKYGGVVKAGRIYSKSAASGQYTGANLWVDSGYNASAYVGISGFNNASAVQMRVSSTGKLEVVSWDSASWASITCAGVTQTSDKDLKGDVTSLPDVLPLLRDKRIVTFRYKVPLSSGGGLSDEKHVGVIAQDWVDDFPELVTELSEEIDADGDFIARQYDPETGEELFGEAGRPVGRKALGFNYSNASAVALKGVIELERLLSAALDRIAVLEEKQA
ncbi:tail fiber domain-containing protein [Burkholderia sp. PU8-34]